MVFSGIGSRNSRKRMNEKEAFSLANNVVLIWHKTLSFIIVELPSNYFQDGFFQRFYFKNESNAPWKC